MSEEEDDDSDKRRRLGTSSTASSSSAAKAVAPPFSDQVLENVLESVLQFITSSKDRNACSLVCRCWHRAEALTRGHLSVGNLYAVHPARAVSRFPHISSLSLKGRPRFADFGLVPLGWGAGFTAWAEAIAASRCARLVRKLVLKRVTVSNSDLELVARGLPSFSELTLVCCDGFGTPGLGALAENCKLLRALDLIDSDVEDGTADDTALVDWISKFPKTHNCLESLSFECVPYPVNLNSLGSLIARSPNLCRLRVNHLISIGQLCRLLLRAPQLTHVGTGMFGSLNEDGELDVKDVEAAFGSLKELTCLSGFRDLKPEFLPAIYPICGQLTSLNLSYADISAEQLEPLIRHCHNLQIFWALDTIGDEGLKAVAATCKDLRELRIFPLDPSEESEGLVSDVGLIYISEGCCKLRSILYFCQRMTNAAVVAMSVNCPDLAVFRLCIMGRHIPDHSTGGPMDEGFGAIVMNCKKLHRLAVSGLLTDHAFGLFGKYGKTIRTLSVAFGGDSDLALKFVLEGCSNLQKLEIRDSPFGDAGLLAGIGHFYNMRFVWLSSCRLTVRGCREVARSLPHMVVEVIGDPLTESPGLKDDEPVEKLYMYRSLAGPREDVPQFVEIL